MKKIFGILILIVVMLFVGIAISQAAQVTLAWDASTDPRVTGYKLYYGTVPHTYGPGVATGKVTEFTLTGIDEGRNVYFAVTAVDATDTLESGFSVELPCWTIVPSVVGAGTITPNVAKVVSNVTGQTFTITPNAGSQIKDVTVDGVSVGKVTTYAFAGVTTSHTIKATFETIPAAVSPVTGLKIK